jgi:hypothetical protein
MSASGNLLLSVFLLCAVVVVVFIIALVLPNPSGTAGGKNWGKLVAGVLATALGIRTLITGYIGHWLYSPEVSASGAGARVIGALLLIMGFIILASWLKERRKAGESAAKGQR